MPKGSLSDLFIGHARHFLQQRLALKVGKSVRLDAEPSPVACRGEDLKSRLCGLVLVQVHLAALPVVFPPKFQGELCAAGVLA